MEAQIAKGDRFWDEFDCVECSFLLGHEQQPPSDQPPSLSQPKAFLSRSISDLHQLLAQQAETLLPHYPWTTSGSHTKSWRTASLSSRA